MLFPRDQYEAIPREKGGRGGGGGTRMRGSLCEQRVGKCLSLSLSLPPFCGLKRAGPADEAAAAAASPDV